MSIRPEWCQKIAAGDKTIEVRKSKPKLETPFKCYIYCTKGNVDMVPSKIWWKADSTGFQHIMNGKVIGEFVCDKILDICIEIEGQQVLPGYPFPSTCLTDKEIVQYLGNGKTGYCWHISELKIYDKPKELSEFVVEGECDCLNCKQCFWDLPGNSYNVESDCGLAYALMYIDELYKPLFKAPQSWCYVEDMKKDDGK